MLADTLRSIEQFRLSPLDLLPQQGLREKLLELVLRGVPPVGHPEVRNRLQSLREKLLTTSVEEVRVVVFGGGTGLSNLIGGDSRLASWARNPFIGLKEVFPRTRAIVCITDDGGSTGELLKDLPIIALGDLRHVLLSSVQLANLQKRYNLDRVEAAEIAAIVAEVFNWRFTGILARSREDFIAVEAKLSRLPRWLEQYLRSLVNYLFSDKRLATTLHRAHCLGNLLLAAAVYREIDQGISNIELAGNQKLLHKALYCGLRSLSEAIGAGERAVLPCTSTPAQLRVLYTNGVEVIGEHQLSRTKRGFPVESVEVDYCDTIRCFDEVIDDILGADILILAPGSLYSSIIPVFKVPGLAEAVRQNHQALKVLVSNLWVQTGETDLSIADPERKFHVSDMIRAYEKNIPGGTKNLFHEVLCISLADIPASVLQRYAVEGKVPIYLDREQLTRQNFSPIECGVYSQKALAERGVIQHDPDTLALAIKALYNGRSCFAGAPAVPATAALAACVSTSPDQRPTRIHPFRRHLGIRERLQRLPITFVGDAGHPEEDQLRRDLGQILFDHPVIPLDHLDYFAGLHCIAPASWHRDQQWDNVFSFFDPADKCIKIRGDQVQLRNNLETALMIALGESLLGDYAARKEMAKVELDRHCLGRVYHLHLCPKEERVCFFTHRQLCTFLMLARMCPTDDENHYTRLVNNGEGFTPPGLLMGLMYAWYIDNRLASHIEYKMSIMKMNPTNLIPEQLKLIGRRREMIDFFKAVVFRTTT